MLSGLAISGDILIIRAEGNKPDADSPWRARRRLPLGKLWALSLPKRQRLVRWKMWHQDSVELRSAALTGIQYCRYVTSPVPARNE
jgi:hypothetical protein